MARSHLDELRRIHREFARINENQEQAVDYYQQKATRVFLFYVIFQAYTLCSIAHAIFPSQFWWIPFVSSLLSTCPSFYHFFYHAVNCFLTQKRLDQTQILEQMIYQKIRRLEGHPTAPTAIDYPRLERQFHAKLRRRIAYVALTGSVMAAFGIIVPYACYSIPIPCHDQIVLLKE